MNQGNHWDVSEGSIDLQLDEADVVLEDVNPEDYDEIEYMPPKFGSPASLLPKCFVNLQSHL